MMDFRDTAGQHRCWRAPGEVHKKLGGIGEGMVDKTKRWENVNLKTAALSKTELIEIKTLLERRIASEGPLSEPRLKAAVKRINALLNAPKPKIKNNVGGQFLGEAPTGRFSGGIGHATFVTGGSPGSKK